MPTMRAKRNLIASVVFLLAGAWIAPAVAAPVPAQEAAATSVIVQATSEAAAHAAVAAHHGTVTQDVWIVNGVAAPVPAGEVAGLAGEPGVTHVSENSPVHVDSAHPSPLHSASAVYPKVVGADKLWNEGVDGTGVTIAVVDTGIANVPDLAGRVIGGADFSGGSNPYSDDFGHGTFVAGLIAGNGASSNGAYKGVAPNAKLVSIKIAGRDGSSDITHVLAAIQWAVSFRNDYGIRVLNLSLGTDSTQPYMLSPLDGAVERAWDAGIVVTVSAGNCGTDPSDPCMIRKPADAATNPTPHQGQAPPPRHPAPRPLRHPNHGGPGPPHPYPAAHARDVRLRQPGRHPLARLGRPPARPGQPAGSDPDRVLPRPDPAHPEPRPPAARREPDRPEPGLRPGHLLLVGVDGVELVRLQLVRLQLVRLQLVRLQLVRLQLVRPQPVREQLVAHRLG